MQRQIPLAIKHLQFFACSTPRQDSNNVCLLMRTSILRHPQRQRGECSRRHVAALKQHLPHGLLVEKLDDGLECLCISDGLSIALAVKR